MVQNWSKLHFSRDIDGKELKVTLQYGISREPAMIGGLTVVLDEKPQRGVLEEEDQIGSQRQLANFWPSVRVGHLYLPSS